MNPRRTRRARAVQAELGAMRLAEGASTDAEVEAAHLAMRRAFPTLAAAYPCDCATCRAAKKRTDP